MKLEKHELSSTLWLKLKTELEQRIDLKRRLNDGALNEIETATLRGELRALKGILALGESSTPVVETADHFD